VSRTRISRDSFDAGLPEQLTVLDSEAGVRNQL